MRTRTGPAAPLGRTKATECKAFAGDREDQENQPPTDQVCDRSAYDPEEVSRKPGESAEEERSREKRRLEDGDHEHAAYEHRGGEGIKSPNHRNRRACE